MDVVIVLGAIVAVALISSRLSDRTVDVLLLIACAVGSLAWLVDDPHGFDYVRSALFGLLAIWLGWQLIRRSTKASSA